MKMKMVNGRMTPFLEYSGKEINIVKYLVDADEDDLKYMEEVLIKKREWDYVFWRLKEAFRERDEKDDIIFHIIVWLRMNPNSGKRVIKEVFHIRHNVIGRFF